MSFAVDSVVEIAGRVMPDPEWNQTDRTYPEALLHEAFAAQAARQPTSPAVTFRDESITYSELDERVGLLTSRILSHGVPPRSLIAVFMDRSLDLVVTLHAILRAGCAYVPIDPDYPADRIAMMLEDLDEPIVLTQQALADRLAGTRATVVAVDDDSTAATLPTQFGQSESLSTGPGPFVILPPKASPEWLAYAIFTSGSTGRPKAAGITHGAIANLTYWMQEDIGLTASDKVLLKTPASFDVSLYELFWPLLFGAHLVVAEPGGHRDSAYLTQMIIEHGITTINFVPSMLDLFLEDPRARECVSLKHVIAAGEALPKALQDRFFTRLPGAALHNFYGPTEAQTVTAWTCDPASPLPFVPIGRPIANTQMHVLDADMRPVAVGEIGDLHIGGVQVSTGYLKRPELTAERFIADPFRPGGTLYKTGDVARWLSDGSIEFLGRSDFQVKIRGFRVELGEIEAALESIEGVRRAVVVDRQRSGGETELVAYLAQPDGAGLPTEEIRSRLAAGLPEYMVPTTFIAVERFELNPNGKVDRKKLPSPVRVRPDLGTPYVAPRTELQRYIAALWCEILDVDRVGIHDRFFELGGTSIQAARFVNQLQADLGEVIFVVTLFGAPSVAEYATLLEQQFAAAVERKLGAGPSRKGDVAGAGRAGAAATRAGAATTVPSEGKGDPARDVPTDDSALIASAPIASAPTASAPTASAGRSSARDDIAIIGMAGRFPGAPDVDTFWANLCEGVESIRPVTPEELAEADTSVPGFVGMKASMDDSESFDAQFFGMSRREAEVTDPQHRVLLETVWGALEHAGYDPATVDGRIGIFGGVAENEYFRTNVLPDDALVNRIGETQLLLASAREYAITRAAFKLGFTGPAVPVLTACSTSAVAVHLAVRSLLAGESDLALAGAARLGIRTRGGYVYEEGGIWAPDGHVRPFDAGAQGTVMASGVAFIALKRLDEALADGDTVYAVIRGSAINNDGSAKVGFTAPSIEGQRRVVEDALAAARVDAATIGLIEAHGTGTSLGDPIEVTALTQAFRTHTDQRQYCAIGSLKSNVGHLEAAAGVTGIIKAALSLHHERIPASINFSSPNPQIDFPSTPFFVNTTLREWRRTDQPRRAGVSSFGFGGTNAHVILEEAPSTAAAPPAVPSTAPLILPLSAKTADAAQRRAIQLADHLESHPEVDLADVAFTLAQGRARMPHRRAVVSGDLASAVSLLRSPQRSAGVQRSASVQRADSVQRHTTATGAQVAFLFTGQGAQYAGMGADLYRTEAVYRAAVDECARIAGPIHGRSLIELLQYGSHDASAADPDLIMQTVASQPAIFTVQYALAKLWASWGIQPAAMVGHSVGEIVAACLGGVFPLETALGFAVARGRLMQDLGLGAMTAVMTDASDVEPLLDELTSLAAVNAPEQCVASGPAASIEELERQLAARNHPFRRLPTSRAFHSPMMEAAVEPLVAHLAGAESGALDIPMVSTVTADWVSAAELSDPTYWGNHALMTVRFSDAVGVLISERPDLLLLEVGPGETLTSLARQHPAATPGTVTISSLPSRGRGPDAAIHVRRALADVWASGADVDWSAVHGGHRRRVALPTYPFTRDRHWIEPKRAATAPVGSSKEARRGPTQDSAVATGGAGVSDAPSTRLSTESATLAVRASSDAAPGRESSRQARIAEQLTSLLMDLSGLTATELDVNSQFCDLGFDSLFLSQANAQIRKQFSVRTTVRHLLSETPTLESLAAFIDSQLPADPVIDEAPPAGESVSTTAVREDWTAAPQPAAGLPVGAGTTADPVRSRLDQSQHPQVAPDPIRSDRSAGNQAPAGQAAWEPVHLLIQEQLRLMDKQLELLRAHGQAGASGAANTEATAAGIVLDHAAGNHTPAAPATGMTPWGPVPVLPNVSRYLDERKSPHPEHWNMGMLLVPNRPLDHETTKKAVGALLERHDALRLRFHRDGDRWASSLAAVSNDVPLTHCDLSTVEPPEQAAAVERRADEVQRSLSLTQGPLIRFELLDLGQGQQRLLLVAHHFVTDQMSVPMLWEDFEQLYDAFESGARAVPAPPATTFENWARALQRLADSQEIRNEMKVWRDLPWEQVKPIPLDHPHGANTNESGAHVQVVLTSAETSSLLRQTTGVIRKADLIIGALAAAVGDWSRSETVLIDLMGHGRDDDLIDGLDPHATLGFFVSYTPLVLQQGDRHPGLGHESLSEQIDRLLGRGLDFDLLRHMTSDSALREEFRGLPKAQILFNHHTPDEAPRSSRFTMAPESSGQTHDPRGIRYYPLAVSSEFRDGQLGVRFVYSANLHDRATIAALAESFRSQLLQRIARAAA